MTLSESPQVVLVRRANLLELVPHPLGGVVRRVGMAGVGCGKPA
ncbi:hypothetical protein ABH931_002780 [Streptacidiphilus sp. MAP12-33]